MSSDNRQAVVLVPMDDGNAHLYNSIPSRYEITGQLSLRFEDGSWSFVIDHLPRPYAVKTYQNDPLPPHGRHAVFFSMFGGQCTGQVHIAEFWNGMARVEDIRVAEGFRRKGIGRKLMDAAADWAARQGFQVLCLETQSNNAAACRFYSRYGFTLKGADTAVYDTTQNAGETALYWYLPLEQ
jgi:streptothricin acetyltransferase